MKVWLLYPDREFDLKNSYAKKEDLVKDLNLHIIYKTMSREDEYFYQAAAKVMMKPLLDKSEIEYRHGMMKDAIKCRDEFMEIYETARVAVKSVNEYNESYKRRKGDLAAASMVTELLNYMDFLVKQLGRLSYFLDDYREKFTSEAMLSFCDRFKAEYGDGRMEKILSELGNLDFWTAGGKLTLSGTCGVGMKPEKFMVNGVVRRRKRKAAKNISVVEKVNLMFKQNAFVLESDEERLEAKELEKVAIAHVLQVYDDFIKELEQFFWQLKLQMAFYAACGNFCKRLEEIGLPLCFPEVTEKGNGMYIGLYELTYAIYIQKKPVVNGLRIDDKRLLFVTGANQGGKSTFLRSMGVAQVLFQCGMPVPADTFIGRIYDNVFTHFTRREDSSMNSGRLEEELKRMNGIIDEVTPKSLLLLNESFASTTEKEGAVIMSGIVRALAELGCSVFIVTHLYEFVRNVFAQQPDYAMFLSAERKNNGTRTYRMVPREPGHTSYGLDLYEDMIGKITDVEEPDNL